MTKREAYVAFERADDAWDDMLRSIWGKRAGDERYTKAAKGEPGTVLRNLYEMRDIARQMWEAAK